MNKLGVDILNSAGPVINFISSYFKYAFFDYVGTMFLGSQPPRGMTSPSPRHQQDSRSPREFSGGGGMPPSTSPALLPNQGKTHPGLKVVIPNSSRQVNVL